MSTRHPKLNALQLIRILESKDFYKTRQSGSHAIFINADGRRTTVPVHGKKELGIGLLKQIMKDADLTLDDLTD